MTISMETSRQSLEEFFSIKELDGIHEFIDWDRIEGLLQGIHASTRGEKAWPPLLMVKERLLQSCYKLSDPALEKQLARDLLFGSVRKTYARLAFLLWSLESRGGIGSGSQGVSGVLIRDRRSQPGAEAASTGCFARQS